MLDSAGVHLGILGSIIVTRDNVYIISGVTLLALEDVHVTKFHKSDVRGCVPQSFTIIARAAVAISLSAN